MFAFLLSAVAISLSGVITPGPITAAALAAGSRSRHAGVLVAVGHAMVEVPLILLLAGGIGTFLASPTVKASIGLAGGVVLVFMGVQLLVSLRSGNAEAAAAVERHPVMMGLVVTGTNPYFLLWWATIGLALTVQATQYGAAILLAFAAVHWLCDLGWMEVLSIAGFKGTQTFGKRSEQVVSFVCALVLLGFGLKFLYEAARTFAIHLGS
jgi:threonine/homoserine/homoserine lactone efflux protein